MKTDTFQSRNNLKNRMKILYVDPWCAKGSNLYYYSTGLVGAISNYADVVLVSANNFVVPSDQEGKYTINNLFFTHSNKMKRGILRKFIRGIEYIAAYKKILKLSKTSHFDLIHIEWPLFYKIDIKYFKKLKKQCCALTIKAHNILPHSSDMKYAKYCEKIYSIADMVIVHGLNMKQEFAEYFPTLSNKVSIQMHGVYSNFKTNYALELIERSIIEKVQKYKRIYLFCGRIDRDKGVDRIAKAWSDSLNGGESLLIIAGKTADGYSIEPMKKALGKFHNVIIYDDYVPDNLLNFFISKCSLIVLPYLKGSMSGLVFTAARFSKPLFSTKFGVIEEYILDGVNSFLVDNSYEAFYQEFCYIDNCVSDSTLSVMGKNLAKYIESNFNWDTIGKKLVNETYKKLLEQKRVVSLKRVG